MTTDGNAEAGSTGVVIQCIRVNNFRCLRLVEVSLTPMTVLIGENNSGKTSFLDAVYAVLGSGPRHLTEEDIYLDGNETKPPRDREITVDILVRPTDESGSVLDEFPAGSPWLELWGNGVVQDQDENDMVAIRMTMSWDRIKGDYFVQRRFLKEWKADVANMLDAEVAQHITQVTAAQTAPLSLYLLDAKRDAAEEMRTRGSVWNKLIADHGLSDEDVETIEQQLTDINQFLVERSGVLSHVQKHLTHVSRVVRCDEDNIDVNPVARRLRDLSKGMDVVLATDGAPQFPLARQGMGTRSLASVLLFRAYMTWRQTQQATEALHPFVAIEEPETHLHPQAQRALFQQLDDVPGQRLITTHSPYVCSQADIESFVHFSKNGNTTSVSRFYGPTDDLLGPEDIRAINRRVMQTRGDLLFSRCVVLFEGETEEQALPDFAERYWGHHPNYLGVTFISVDGSGNYLPFLRLTTQFQIPWVIFSDGEQTAIDAVNNSLQQVGEAAVDDNPRCVVIPNGENFEEFVVTNDSLQVVQAMIADFKIELAGITAPRGIEGIQQNWASKNLDEVRAEVLARKTAYGARIASAFANRSTRDERIPQLLQEVFDLAVPPTPADAGGDDGD